MNNLYSAASLLSAVASSKSDTSNMLCLEGTGANSTTMQSLGTILKNQGQNLSLNSMCITPTQSMSSHPILNPGFGGPRIPDTNTPQLFFPIGNQSLARLGNQNAAAVPNSFNLMATNQDISALLHSNLSNAPGNILNNSQFLNLGNHGLALNSQAPSVNGAGLNSSLGSTSAISPFIFSNIMESNLSSLGVPKHNSSPANVFPTSLLPDSSLNNVQISDASFQSRLAVSMPGANSISSLNPSQVPNAQLVSQHPSVFKSTDVLGKRSQVEDTKNPFDQLVDSYEGYNRRIKSAKKAGELKVSSKVEIDSAERGASRTRSGGDEQPQDVVTGQSSTKIEHRSISRKRLGILHDRRGRLREVEDLFLDCMAMRPYIELGYSSQALLSAFADTRGVLLDSIREAASIAQSAIDILAAQGKFPSESAAQEAQRMHEKKSWISFEFDPVSGKRKTISCGPSISDIVGISEEDLIAKFYAHEVRLPCSEIDFVCFVIEDLLYSVDSATRHFVVHTKGASWMRQGKDTESNKNDFSKPDLLTKDTGAYDAEVLTVSHVFERDERGRLVRLTASYDIADEDDYQKVLSSVSPPLSVHTRDGKDFQSMLWRHKVAIQCVGKLLHIKKSPEGRAKLMALANSIRKRSNDLKCKFLTCPGSTVVKSQE
mmetsp:Transcript_35009/g.109430  ORF Transcript_35009/g.109430 Transcript_35009/m.109430 type:complete len:658 (-) Transcript_35009:112-2085(-)